MAKHDVGRRLYMLLQSSNHSRGDVTKLAEEAEKEGNTYVALQAYMAIQDKDSVRKLAEQAFREEKFADSQFAYSFLKDQQGMVDSALGDFRKYGIAPNLEMDLQKILVHTTQVFSKFRECSSAHNWPRLESIVNSPGTILASNQLSPQYDFCIGIARAGLFASYLFNVYGTPIAVAECHKRSKSKKVKWLDAKVLPELHGKKVIVADKDVVTGTTSRKVLEEIKKHGPKQVDILLLHGPRGAERGINSLAENIPAGYQNIYFPSSFDYNNFPQALAELQKKLNAKA